MKVKLSDPKMFYSQIEAGDVFVFGNTLWMRTQKDGRPGPHAVALRDGEWAEFDDCEPVERAHGTFMEGYDAE
jgi:hypothetical protein